MLFFVLSTQAFNRAEARQLDVGIYVRKMFATKNEMENPSLLVDIQQKNSILQG